MEARKSPDTQAFALMVFFCLILGLQQIVLKATSDDVAPILQIAIRSGIAALLVWSYMRWQGESLLLREGNWKPGLWVGVLFTLEYLFLGEALKFTSASHAVVFLYTAPVFAALILHFLLPSERMSRLQWSGIALAFLGMVLAFLWDEADTYQGETSTRLLGDGLAILAGAAWGGTTVLIRTSRLAQASPRETLLYQLVIAFVLLLLASYASNQLRVVPSTEAIASIAFQGIFVSFLGFLIWFWLLRNYHASPIGILSFMTPVFGVLLGAWLLSEPLTPGFLGGSLLVIVGVILVSGEGIFRQYLTQETA